MSGNYWLADREARVLGPVGLDVIRDLAVRGKLMDVRAVSRDGRTFVPVREVPELASVLSPPKEDDLAVAQSQATNQIRDWLAGVRGRPTHEIFRIPERSSPETYRAAFFALVHRYVPGRLPPEATPELRLACEDAFLFLAERIVEVEKKTAFAASGARPPPARSYPTPAPAVPPQGKSAPPEVTWRGGMLHVRVSLGRGDAEPFIADPDATWKSDSLFVTTTEKPMVGTMAEVTISFEGHVSEVSSSGRVVNVRGYPKQGISVKMLDLAEAQRSMIRTWVQRSGR